MKNGPELQECGVSCTAMKRCKGWWCRYH